MHLYAYSSRVFLFFVLTNYGVLSDSIIANTEEEPAKDSMFADVIKNITRVNNVLQDLIKNYEKLQKIYKSQETIESYSNEEDEDEEGHFRGRQKKKTKIEEKSTTKNLPFPATQMIFSSEEFTSHEGKKTIAKEVTNAERLKKKFKEKKTTTENEIASEASSEESENEETRSKKDKTKSTRKPNKTEKVAKKESSKTMLGVNNEMPSKSQTQVKKDNQTKTYKKQIIQTEKFSGNNIWTEMVNKPVDLQKEKEIIYSKRKAEKNDVIFRTETDKKLAANVSKKEVKDNVTLTSGSVEDDKTIKKEQFKTAILRKAYGDACLKVVVKKCYKACKQVIKDSCSRYTCKSNFKMAFKEHSKTGCIKELREMELTQKVSKGDSMHIRADATSEFLDITRNGYLAAACLPSGKAARNIETKPKRRGEIGPHKRTETELDKKLNILRDRFERACQETSSNKCDKACAYAVEETCSIHECHKKKKGDLRKTCRKACDAAYKSEKSSASESGSTGSGSSVTSESDEGIEDKRTTKRIIKIITNPTTSKKRKFRIKTAAKSERGKFKKMAASANNNDSEDDDTRAGRTPQLNKPSKDKEKPNTKADKEKKKNILKKDNQ